MDTHIGYSARRSEVDYEHAHDLGQRVVYELQVWTVVGIHVSRAAVLSYTLEREIVGGGAMRVRAYPDAIKDPNP